MPQAREDLAELVACRSVADPRQSPPEECERAAQWLIDAFSAVGLDGMRTYVTPDGSKAVYGHAAGPEGAPTVLLYSHYDVQPALGEEEWETPVWQLTERDGRWYGRGAADCKGNIVMHLTALRTLQRRFPVAIKFISEGSEEVGTGGLEQFVPLNADLLRADVIVVADSGNLAVGVPGLTTSLRGVANVIVTVRTLEGGMHSGSFGGAAPDALAALISMLATLRDERGNTTISGLDNSGVWAGAEYPVDRFRADARVLDGIDLLGQGTVADQLWARPAVTVLGIDCPPVVGSSGEIQPEARARLNLRVPPGIGAKDAQTLLIEHLQAVAPWNVRLEFEREADGEPFLGATAGPAYDAISEAMEEAYGVAPLTQGQGGSIPLCNVLRDTYPEAEILLLGVEEPLCLIHAPNESVHPSEIENLALAEVLFLQKYAKMRSSATRRRCLPMTHEHGPGCGHTAIRHGDHVDYLHDGVLHRHGAGCAEDHALEISDANPGACTPDHACGGHETGHAHGPGCGHEAVPHGDHVDYLVRGHLHSPHGDHCDDHGAVAVES